MLQPSPAHRKALARERCTKITIIPADKSGLPPYLLGVCEGIVTYSRRSGETLKQTVKRWEAETGRRAFVASLAV